jgi:hypothetical protein
MKIATKTLIKLPYLALAMMALTSCSSMNNMQSMPTSAGHGVHITKQHSYVKEQRRVAYVKPHADTSPMPVTIKQQAPSQIMKPVVVQPKPVVVQPKPVVVQPKPVVVQPKPVVVQPKPVVVQPKPVMPAVVSVAIVYPNPIDGDIYLLNVHGLDFKPQNYQPMNGRSVATNIQRLDAKGGKYHYIQASRWDGKHLDQTYVNARTAALMSVIGLGMLQNGHIDTDFGTTIMVLGGNAYIADISGHQVDIVLRRGGDRPAKVAPKVKSGKSTPKSDEMNVTTPENNSFDIGDNQQVVSPEQADTISISNQYCGIDDASALMNLAATTDDELSSAVKAAAAHQQAMLANHEMMAANQQDGTAIGEALREHLEVLEE